MDTIAANLEAVHVRIRTACTAASRDFSSVSLLAVSKTFQSDAVRAAAAAGQPAFGENYVQEGVEKIAALADLRQQLEWHCIGPIQSNKTRLVAEHFDWVQTIDRLKIAERLSAQRPPHLAPLSVCVQVNIGAAPTKSGVAPTEALALCEAVARLPRLVLRGIMVIPDSVDTVNPNAITSIASQNPYTSASALFDHIFSLKLPNMEHFDTLSLGMSADLEPAIAAGSTMVRVGSAIFGARHYG